MGPSAPLTFAEDRVYLLQYPVYKSVPPLGVVRRWVEEAMIGVQRSTRLSRCLETFFLKCDAQLHPYTQVKG